jgi:ketosteroid isomerase-like protein
MASEMTQRFIDALHKIEESGDVQALAELFAEDAELRRLAQTHPEKGPGGVQQFWKEYVSTFNRIHSDFTHITEQDGRAVLEWVSEGEMNNGEPVRYAGVSVIETQDGKVHHFRTYYDSAVFLEEGATKA